MMFSRLWHTHLLLHHFTLHWRKWLPKWWDWFQDFHVFYLFYSYYLFESLNFWTHTYRTYDSNIDGLTQKNFQFDFVGISMYFIEWYIYYCRYTFLLLENLYGLVIFQPENKSKVSPENFFFSANESMWLNCRRRYVWIIWLNDS